MFTDTLLTLAEHSFGIGFIGIDEYIERCEIALWLNDDSGKLQDPRNSCRQDEAPENERKPSLGGGSEMVSEQYNEQASSEDYEFIFNKKWVFTKSDPDPYPSTPHGHWKSQDKKWPKLNPYTGRAFIKKHKEDISLRLKKRDMRILWSDKKFRDFCRGHIQWCKEQFPYHLFPVRHPLRFPRWD